MIDLSVAIPWIMSAFHYLFDVNNSGQPDSGSRRVPRIVWILSPILVALGVYYFTQHRSGEPGIIRIAILLPIEDVPVPSSPAYEDGERQALGFVRLLKKHPEATKRYHFVIINHAMDINRARQSIAEELKNGTLYFVSTMSKIGEPLSEEFPALVKEHAPDKDAPRLIITVASSPRIRTHPDSVYRFYIRSQEEGATLAEAANRNFMVSTASYIAVEDEYGRGAVKSFEERWIERGHSFATGVYLPSNAKEDLIEQLINERLFNVVPQAQRNLIFVAHYGHALPAIVRSLHASGMSRCIAATSTMSIDAWMRPVDSMLKDFNWVIASPVSKVNAAYSGDVVQDFVYFTLDRLLSTLDGQKKSGSTFNDAWIASTEPERIYYQIEANGDSAVKMTYTQSPMRFPCEIQQR